MELSVVWQKVLSELYLDKTVDQEIKNEFLPFTNLYKKNSKEFIIEAKSTLALSFLNQISGQIKTFLSSYINGDFELLFFSTKNLPKIDHEAQNDLNFIKSGQLFENFVIGKSNRQAFIAAKYFSESVDNSVFNPLFIYGDSGLGKTHLLESITNFIKDKSTNNKVLYLKADEFTSQVVSILNSGDADIEKFKNDILKNDVFIIDDVHFLTKRDKTNEFLFYIINNFLENGKKLAFSSDKNPESLNGFERRMITRFNSGLSVCVETLDPQTAEDILKLRIGEFKLKRSVEPAAIKFLANNFGGDARKLKSLVNRLELLVMSNPVDSTITLDEVVVFFKDIPSSNLGKLNVKRIKEIIGDKFGVSVKAIDGKARTTAIKDARHVAMFFVKILLNHTSTQIGSEFGGRDHSTVLSAISKIEKNIYEDKKFKKLIDSWKNEIMN
ncbi:DnaA ATPase domain-containing protein [Mesoplasma corruscae]|uniref:Chromosomal replication initiator protein DnaA n=1 Tax=Mesoplasma corruscae TaxID=216874 RepID=A0A2S5RH55_9MOLU|nr:DnaA/Hda family protein [Mesoplasma corruscae]PPE06669.1 chromosomal replication initiator protein DnaA [Mesoplasma corruscae]